MQSHQIEIGKTPQKCPQSAIDSGCQDIAAQFIAYQSSLNQALSRVLIQTVLRWLWAAACVIFLPKDRAKILQEIAVGTRPDGRNLVDEWKQINPLKVYLPR